MSDEKRLPDEVGFWGNAEGEMVLLQQNPASPHTYFLESGDFEQGGHGKTPQEAVEKAGFRPGRWKKVNPPQFSFRPSVFPCFTRVRPMAVRPYTADQTPEWITVDAEGFVYKVEKVWGVRPSDLEVVDHPGNDCRAVSIINA